MSAQKYLSSSLALVCFVISTNAFGAADKSPALPQQNQKVDPNAALEIRGQARTLSMMLVLKNGKDGINFIKVRKDYHPEITTTEF